MKLILLIVNCLWLQIVLNWYLQQCLSLWKMFYNFSFEFCKIWIDRNAGHKKSVKWERKWSLLWQELSLLHLQMDLLFKVIYSSRLVLNFFLNCNNRNCTFVFALLIVLFDFLLILSTYLYVDVLFKICSTLVPF